MESLEKSKEKRQDWEMNIPRDVLNIICSKLDYQDLRAMFCTCRYVNSLSKSKSFWLEKARSEGGDLEYFSPGEYPLTPKGLYLRCLAHSGKFTLGSEEFASIYQVTLYAAKQRNDLFVKKLATKLIIYKIDNGFPMEKFIDELSTFGYFEEALTLAEIYKCKINRIDCFKACGEQFRKGNLGYMLRNKENEPSGIPLRKHWASLQGSEGMSLFFSSIGFGDHTTIPRNKIRSVVDAVNGRLEDNIPHIIEKEIVNNDRICYWLSELQVSDLFYQLLFQYGFPANWDDTKYQGENYHPFRKKHHRDIVGFRKILEYIPYDIRVRDLDLIPLLYREARHLVFTVPYTASS